MTHAPALSLTHGVKAAAIAAVLLWCPCSLANGLDDFLAFNSSSKTASGHFDQQVFDRSGKAVEKASGTFTFQRPGKFRWTYEKPHKQLLVGDGSKLWIHDPDLNQVTVKRIDQAISSTPAALLAGKDDITKLFTLRDAGPADGLNWVEATPKSQDTGFERVRLDCRADARGDGAIRLVAATPFRFGPETNAGLADTSGSARPKAHVLRTPRRSDPRVIP